MKRDWKMKKMKVLWQVQSLDSTKPTSSRLKSSRVDKNNTQLSYKYEIDVDGSVKKTWN